MSLLRIIFLNTDISSVFHLSVSFIASDDSDRTKRRNPPYHFNYTTKYYQKSNIFYKYIINLQKTKNRTVKSRVDCCFFASNSVDIPLFFHLYLGPCNTGNNRNRSPCRSQKLNSSFKRRAACQHVVNYHERLALRKAFPCALSFAYDPRSE